MECVRPILDFLIGQLKDFVSLETNVHSLTEEMRTLKGKRDDTNRAVANAERQGLQKTSRVKAWLERVQELEEDVSKIDTEFQTMFRCCCERPLNVFSGCILSSNAKRKLEEVSNLINSGDFNVVADDLSLIYTRELPNTPSVGQDKMLALLDSFIIGTEVGIIGIYGMGGVGKTTLLHRFNNELRKLVDIFELVMYIEVSEKVDVEKIQKMIWSRLGGEWKETVDTKERAISILEALNKMNFVIIFDDVWEPLPFSSIGIPIPSSPYGSKIVVSSRVKDVCTRMEAQKIFKVECLRWEEAWNLFLDKVGGEGKELVNSQSEIESYAKAIAKKCGGLPLALTTIGRAMAANRSELEWRYAERSLRTMPTEIQGMEDVLRCLKRSYDNLSNDNLRLCFLYFILYKEGPQISASDPVRYWMGEGLINVMDDICEATVEGRDIIFRLLKAGLLETVDRDHVRMHGMIHNMAKWVACECGKDRNKWLVQPGFNLSEAPELEKWKSAERISLTGNYLSSISTGVPNCPYLVSLMLNENKLLRSFSDGFFKFMLSLRVLDLSYTSIEELPPEIGQLVQLQFLDISWAKLRSVPSELSNLHKLRYLDLSWNPDLTTFPRGVISSFSAELQVLRMHEAFGNWTTGATGSHDLGVPFEELAGLKQLKMLMITVETLEALHQLQAANRLAMPTHLLHLRGLHGTTAISLPSALSCNMMKLGEVSIDDCSDLKEVVVDDKWWCSHGPHLKHLRLVSLHNANIIFKVIPSGCTNGLSKLEIRSCPKIEQLIGEVVETGTQGGTYVVAFPNLQLLYLINLPELKSLCGSMLTLPSLVHLKVDGCPKLKRLPFGPHSCRMLREIQGPREWWDGLEWDDHAVRASFMHFFSVPRCSCHYIHT